MKKQEIETIWYSFHKTTFGLCLIASTEKGICAATFFDTKKEALMDLQKRFPTYVQHQKELPVHIQTARFIDSGKSRVAISLDLHGTPFQKKVWQALQTIPFGKTTTYKALSEKIGGKQYARAVGNAVGKNPVGYIVPCHRVLRESGELGGFHWGIQKKEKMLVSEGIKI